MKDAMMKDAIARFLFYYDAAESLRQGKKRRPTPMD
jgi:hypothetical protein